MADFTANEVSGKVAGSVVQAAVVHGGIHIAHTPRAAPPLPTPRQLPASPPFLIGRERELGDLDAWAQDEACGPLVLTGPAGVGKAALCLAWLHHSSAAFPDGQLYADLRSFGTPIAPLAVLQGFLAALGLPQQDTAGDLAHHAAQFRSATIGRRMAVMLHGAASTAQVRPLLPGGTTCRTIVTTTWRLPGLRSHGARWLPLAPLADDAAVRLLEQIAGAERIAADTRAARKVAELCGRLPLALCLAGNQLAYNDYQRLDRLAERLADERRRLDRLTEEGEGVRAVIDSCYRGLPPDAARLYRLLGGLPLTRFSTPVASAAAELPEADAGDLLRVLSEANLVQQTGEDRYQFHELIRLHARETSHGGPDEEREQATIRVERWHLATAAAAATAVRPYRRDRPGDLANLTTAPLTFTSLHAALDWLDIEAPQLLDVARHAARQQRPRTALRITSQMWSLFAHRKYYRIWQEFDQLGLRCARELGDQAAEARMLRRLGLLAADLGRYDEATRHLSAAAACYEQLGDSHRQATAINSLGLTALRRGDPRTAVTRLSRALAMHQELGDTRQAALVLIDLADALIETGRADEALERLAQAEEGLRDSPDLYSRAHLRMLTGRASGHAGHDAQRARAELDEAIAAMEALVSTAGQIEALGYRGELAERENAPDEARSYYVTATALLDRLSAPSGAWLRQRISTLSPLAAQILSRPPGRHPGGHPSDRP